MPLDPGNIADYARLHTAVTGACQKKKVRERQRMVLLKKMTGPYYGDDGSKEKRPLNFIELGVDLFQRGLASHLPQCMVSTEYDELQPTGADFELVLNRTIEHKIKLQQSLNICAIEALFTMGVMCTGLAIDDRSQAVRTFAEPVLFPDLILDMNAKSWEQQTFIGHDFVVPFETIKNSELYEGKGKERFIRIRDAMYANRTSDTDWARNGEDYLELVCLRQLWLPHQHRVIICDPGNMPGVQSTRIPLLNNEWEGPDDGPYRNLQFNVVPGHLFPRAPVPYWNDLDDIINLSFNKASRQNLRRKTVGLARNADDAKVVQDLKDGEIGPADPNSVEEKSFGGADQQLLSMVEYSKRLLVYLGGNWDALGGLAPQSGTVGQDQLLSEGAAGRMKDMQKAVMEFETKVMGDIAYWTWQDPLIDEPFFKKLDGTPYGEFGRWSPESRQGEFFQYNFQCNPYARITRTPAEQSSKLLQIVMQVILPSIPHMQQGSPINWEFLFKLISRYENLPELNQIVEYPQGGAIPERSPDTPPAKQTSTTRNYVRTNKTQGGPGIEDKILAGLFTGGQSQQLENAAVAAG